LICLATDYDLKLKALVLQSFFLTLCSLTLSIALVAI